MEFDKKFKNAIPMSQMEWPPIGDLLDAFVKFQKPHVFGTRTYNCELTKEFTNCYFFDSIRSPYFKRDKKPLVTWDDKPATPRKNVYINDNLILTRTKNSYIDDTEIIKIGYAIKICHNINKIVYLKHVGGDINNKDDIIVGYFADNYERLN